MHITSTINAFLHLSWYYQVILILVGTGFINYLMSISISRLHRRYLDTHPIKDIAVTSLKPPLHFFIIALGLSIIVQMLAFEFKWTHNVFIGSIKFVTTVVAIVWFLMRLINKFEAHLILNLKSKHSKLDKTSLDALAKVSRIAILVIAGLICMEALGFSISGILAFGSVSGVIMGFASKDMLANFFGAVTIYLDKPFKVGDWIRLQEKAIEGHVEKINWRCTVIRSLDKRPIYVPNSMFSLIPIENASQMSHRQIHETFGIRHEDFPMLEQILQDIKQMLSEHPNIDTKQVCTANFTGFTPSATNITIMCFTKSVDYADFFGVKENVLMAAANIVEKYEAKMAQLVTVVAK